MIPSDLVIKIGNLDNYNNNILIATDNMEFGINNINNNLVLPPIPKPANLPVTNNIKNNNIIKTNDIVTTRDDSVFKDYHENKYILPLIVGGSIGLLIYFIK